MNSSSQLFKKKQTHEYEHGEPQRNMVFHNSTSKSINGLVLKISAGRCNSGKKFTNNS